MWPKADYGMVAGGTLRRAPRALARDRADAVHRDDRRDHLGDHHAGPPAKDRSHTSRGQLAPRPGQPDRIAESGRHDSTRPKPSAHATRTEQIRAGADGRAGLDLRALRPAVRRVRPAGPGPAADHDHGPVLALLARPAGGPMNDLPKLVFSTILTEPPAWTNARLASRDRPGRSRRSNGSPASRCAPSAASPWSGT